MNEYFEAKKHKPGPDQKIFSPHENRQDAASGNQEAI
jgi:hypothetical protein